MIFNSKKCEYGGCKYNEDSYCINEVCEPIFDDNKCRYCGEYLQKHIDKVEYWGAIVNMETWYCPNCG